MATYNNADITALFRDQQRARKAALDMALSAQQQQGADALAQQQQQYNTARGQAYTNSRVTALGNNENLAASGLAGNAYAAPMTGYSETSRIAQNTALGNALNTLNAQQQSAANDINSTLAQAKTTNNANWLNTLADLQQQEYSAQQSAYQTELSRQQAADEMALNQQSAALSKAQLEIQMFGKVMTQATADTLGVPIGTQMYGYSSGSGGGGGGGVDFDKYIDTFGDYTNRTIVNGVSSPVLVGGSTSLTGSGGANAGGSNYTPTYTTADEQKAKKAAAAKKAMLQETLRKYATR